MATETIVSPGVLLQEIDKSFITPGTDPSGLAIIGPAARGPIEIPTEITNYNSFKEIFGTTVRSGSQAYEYFTNLAVKNYFDNGGASAIVTRVVSASDSWAAATNTSLSSNGINSITGQVKSDAALVVGSGNNDDYTADASLTDIATGGGGGTGLTLDITISAGGAVATIAVNAQGSGYSNTDVITIAGTLLGGTGTISLTALTAGQVENVSAAPFQLETLGKGADLNSVGPEYTGGALHSGSKDNFRWEIGNINNKNGTFTVSIRRGDDTTASPLVLEQFTNCSLDPLSPNYISKKVGDQLLSQSLDGTDYVVNVEGEFENKSNFVRVSAVNLPTYQFLAPDGSVNIDSNGISYSASLPIAQTGTFENGAGINTPTGFSAKFGSDAGNDGLATGSIQGLIPDDYTAAIGLLKNKDEYKFKTLVAPGLNQQNHSTTIATIISNTTERGDNLFVADLVQYGASVSTTKTESEELDTNYAASYWPWVQVRSTELNRNVWCPASTVIPGVFAKNDSIAAPWFAPAGETRGKLGRLGIKTEAKLSKAQRDDLYTSKVNPIATFPDVGLVVFGQKTLQQATSALDRVNVRRLLLDVKDTIGGFSEKLVFEQNTQQTRDRFVRQATPYLESLVQRQGLYAFQVKMDGQLNTSDVIDENKLVGQVFLQPTKTAEFVVLDFTITPTGASFTD